MLSIVLNVVTEGHARARCGSIINMNDDDNDGISEYIFDRIEKTGVAVVTVADGTMFGFSLEMLKRMVADAEASPSKSVIAFVQRDQRKKVAA